MYGIVSGQKSRTISKSQHLVPLESWKPDLRGHEIRLESVRHPFKLKIVVLDRSCLGSKRKKHLLREQIYARHRGWQLQINHEPSKHQFAKISNSCIFWT